MASFTPTGVEFVAQNLNKYLSDLGKADKAQQGLGKSAGTVGKSFSSLGKGIVGFGAMAATAAVTGVAALGAGVAAVGVTSVNTAIKFESAFAGVTKTIDGLSDSTGKLTQFGRQIRSEFETLSTQIPATFEDIAAVGEIGGQLGVGAESITAFTETVIGLRETTNLTADEAATALARIGNIYEVTSGQLGENTKQIGSTIVALGNQFATTESEIINFGLRIAGAGKIAGLSQADILGLGAAFSSIGIEAEAGGTAVQKVLLAMNGAINATSDGFVDNSKQIDKNVAKLTKLQAESARLEAQFPGLQDELLAQRDAFIAAGGSADEWGRQLGDKTRQKAFETAFAIQELNQETQLLRDQQGQPIDPGQLTKFAKIAGISADEFRQLWEEDAAGAFKMFVEGLGKDSDNAEQALKDLGLADQRLIRAFLGLSEAGDVLDRTLKVASESWNENTALTEEAQKRYATTAAQIQILKNNFTLLAAQIGEKFLPIVDIVIQKVRELFEAFQSEGITGLLDQLGITPDAIELFNKITNSALALANAIAGVLAPSLSQVSVLDTINATITYLNNNFDSFQQTVINVANQVGAAMAIIGNAFAAIQPQIQTIINNLTMALQAMGLNWSDVWNAIQQATIIVATAIGAILLGIIAGITAFATAIATALATSTGYIQQFGSFFQMTIEGVATVWAGLVALFTAGDWETAQQAILTITEGTWQTIVGLFGSVATAIQAGLAASVAFITTFGETVVQVFMDLYNAIIGNSIVPDMIQAIIVAFSNMAQPILDIFAGLSEGIATVLGAIFGGGEGGGFGEMFIFDPAEMLAGLNQIKSVITQVNAQIMLMSNELIPLLLEIFAETMPIIAALWTNQNMLVMQHNNMILMLSTVLLPQLLNQSNMTAQTMAAGFMMVNAVLEQTLALIEQITSSVMKMAESARKATEIMTKGFSKAATSLEKLKSKLKELEQGFNAVAQAAREAAKASAALSGNAAAAGIGGSKGIGLKHGLGFQFGTGSNTNSLLGLGFKVPPGFPNDSFGPLFVQSGEEVLVTPANTSIDNIVLERLAGLLGGLQAGGNTEINMPIYTAATPEAIIQRLEVAKALIAD